MPGPESTFKAFSMPVSGRKRGSHGMRSQSAMEYLTTYGWAILIIAAVLAALFQLGVFSGAFAPRAQPGQCYVNRPNGPETTLGMSLAGSCLNQMPQYVGQFDGASAYVDLGNSPELDLGTGSFTITAWIKPRYPPNAYGSYAQVVAKTTSGGTGGYEFGWRGSTTCSTTYATNGPSSISGGSDDICADSWAFVSLTSSSSGTGALYINGQLAGSGNIIFPSSAMDTGIGRAPARTSPPLYFNGSIANVQVYNASLPASDIYSLYKEGIGGAPIDLLYLNGWWPLNGNAKDYSGNGNDGTSNSATYISGWTSGYTNP